MSFSDLPAVNASLNFISFILLSLGYYNIKKGRVPIHKRFMISAAITSGLFLISYTIYLAGIMAPFIVLLLIFALRGRFDRHRKLAIWVWPVWIYVSISGILIYLMLYVL